MSHGFHGQPFSLRPVFVGKELNFSFMHCLRGASPHQSDNFGADCRRPMVHFISLLVSVIERFWSVPFQLGNALASTGRVRTWTASLTEYVPKKANFGRGHLEVPVAQEGPERRNVIRHATCAPWVVDFFRLIFHSPVSSSRCHVTSAPITIIGFVLLLSRVVTLFFVAGVVSISNELGKPSGLQRD